MRSRFQNVIGFTPVQMYVCMCERTGALPPLRLFEMGFAEQLQEIIRRLPDTRQTLLFSATLPKLLVEFARAGEINVQFCFYMHPTCLRIITLTLSRGHCLHDSLQMNVK